MTIATAPATTANTTRAVRAALRNAGEPLLGAQSTAPAFKVVAQADAPEGQVHVYFTASDAAARPDCTQQTEALLRASEPIVALRRFEVVYEGAYTRLVVTPC